MVPSVDTVYEACSVTVTRKEWCIVWEQWRKWKRGVYQGQCYHRDHPVPATSHHCPTWSWWWWVKARSANAHTDSWSVSMRNLNRSIKDVTSEFFCLSVYTWLSLQGNYVRPETFSAGLPHNQNCYKNYRTVFSLWVTDKIWSMLAVLSITTDICTGRRSACPATKAWKWETQKKKVMCIVINELIIGYIYLNDAW